MLNGYFYIPFLSIINNMDRKEIERTFCEIADDLIFKKKKELIERAIEDLSKKKEELHERITLLEKALESVNRYGLSNVEFEYNGKTYNAKSILYKAEKEHLFGRPYISSDLYVLIEPEKEYVYIGIIRIYPNYTIDFLKNEVIEKIKEELEYAKREVERLKLSNVVKEEKVKELLILQEAFNKVCKI